jgi:hypothetical protein
MKNINSLIFCVLLLVLGAFAGPHALASTILDVNLDTRSLIGNPLCPCDINYQLTHGDPTSINSVNISNIGLGGGSPQGLADVIGGVSGDLSNSVVLNTASFLNDFVQRFTPGDFLRFTLSFSTNYSGSGAPDRLTFAILANGVEIPTTGPGDALLGIDLVPSSLVETYGADPTRTGLVLGPPQVVPEPASFLLIGTALLGISALARRIRRTATK